MGKARSCLSLKGKDMWAVLSSFHPAVANLDVMVGAQAPSWIIRRKASPGRLRGACTRHLHGAPRLWPLSYAEERTLWAEATVH